jgi:hypothetical protein
MKKQGKAETGVGDTEIQSGAIAKLAPQRTDTKQAKVVELLQREQGATIAEMQASTGWLSHTTRAVLTGIRKRGATIEKTKVNGVTRYKAVVVK